MQAINCSFDADRLFLVVMQKLSYFNILLALIYLLVYLRSGTFHSAFGILIVIVFNWLYLKSYEQNQYRWNVLHYLIAAWEIYFVGTIGYGAFHVLAAAVEYNFITTDTIINIFLSLTLSLSVFIHLIRYWIENHKVDKN